MSTNPYGEGRFPPGPYPAPGQPYPPGAYPQAAYPQGPYPQPAAAPQPASVVFPQPGAPQPGQPPSGQGGYPAVQPLPAQPYPYAQPGAPQPVYPAQPTPVVQPVRPAPMPIQPVAHAPQPVQPATPQPQAIRPVPVQPASGGLRPVSVTAAAAAGLRPVPATGAQPTLPRDPAKAEGEEGEGEPDAATKQLVRGAPPWLISLIVHAAGLLIMAFILLPPLMSRVVELEVIYAEEEGVQLEDDLLDSPLMEQLEVEKAELSLDMTPVDDPLAAPPELEITTIEGVTTTSTIDAPSIGMALTGREPGMKKALLAAYGGTATTEAAVLRGLEWLKRNQQREGMWSLSGPYSSGATIENRCAATAMALLAFQGAGNTHRTGQFKDTVAKGWDAFLKTQDKDGNFYPGGGGHNHRLYSQAQATIAICELYGMTKDPQYRKPAQLSIDYAVKIQAPEGGWRYTPGEDSDLSVTGWFVMALQSAMMAGLEVPSPTLDRVSKFLDNVSINEGREYSYLIGRSQSSPAMTAEGLLCRQYLGWKHNDPRLVDGTRLLSSNPINMSDQNVYYWYYATQVTHHMGGEDWKRWNGVMREAIPRAQVQTGPEAGSWAPDNDRWGAHGGRLFTTCLQIYMLEVYYRHLPIYKVTLH